MYGNNINSDEMLKTIKEESRIHEENIENKIKEETSKLKNTLNKIKKEMAKFSNQKSSENENEGEDEIDQDSKNLDEDIIRKIQLSPALSPIPNFTDKSPDINSMSNTANNKFFTAKEINNDSALSSFHMHNINNNREKLKIPKELKEKTIKMGKNDSRLSTNNKANSNNNSIEGGRANNTELDNSSQNKHMNNSQISQGHKTPNDNLLKSKSIQMNSLSLSESKDKKSDEEYREGTHNPQKSVHDRDEKSMEVHRQSYTNEIDSSQNNPHLHINDFSKSGTFKSESNANRDSISNNKNYQDVNTNSHSDNNYESNSNFYANNNNMNKYASSNYSNFYPEGGNNFSETISSLGKDIRNNESYLDYNKNINENKSMSNFNVNSSTLNVMIKRDLHEYLSNLENKQLIRLNTNRKNEWVLQFNEEMSSPVRENRQDDVNKKEGLSDKREDDRRASTANFKAKNNSVNKKINEQKKMYTELRNEIDILKREKQGLEKFIMEKDSLNRTKNGNIKNVYVENSSSIENKNKSKRLNQNSTVKSNINSTTNKNSEPSIEQNSAYNTSNLDRNNHTKNSNYYSSSRDNASLKQYESEVLEKIKREDIFSDITDNNTNSNDYLGDFVDRVIERSLYIYKNKNCHTCSRLLSTGKSTSLCPKNHK